MPWMKGKLMDLYAHCLFYAAHLGTIEKQHGSKPTSEPVVKEIREIANFFFDQMEWRFNHEHPKITA